MKTEQGKDIEQYLSTGELMGTLSISRSTVNRMVQRGLPHVWVGAVRRFPVDQVIEWLKQAPVHA
ncbi:MAG: helix-turn-helix domain-containing protein [Deltaproteobacteria bacterium]|nr:helix-turn-helix domain-containing protein [Deltaproteobacteria bacterium]